MASEGLSLGLKRNSAWKPNGPADVRLLYTFIPTGWITDVNTFLRAPLWPLLPFAASSLDLLTYGTLPAYQFDSTLAPPENGASNPPT